MYYFLSYFTACSYMMAKLDLRDNSKLLHPVSVTNQVSLATRSNDCY